MHHTPRDKSKSFFSIQLESFSNKTVILVPTVLSFFVMNNDIVWFLADVSLIQHLSLLKLSNCQQGQEHIQVFKGKFISYLYIIFFHNFEKFIICDLPVLLNVLRFPKDWISSILQTPDPHYLLHLLQHADYQHVLLTAKNLKTRSQQQLGFVLCISSSR